MHQRVDTLTTVKNGGETICQWIFLVHHDMWCLWLMTKVLNDDLDEMWTCQWSILFALFQILPSLHHMWRGHQEVGGFLDSQVTLNFENLKMTKPLTNILNNNNNNNDILILLFQMEHLDSQVKLNFENLKSKTVTKPLTNNLNNNLKQ